MISFDQAEAAGRIDHGQADIASLGPVELKGVSGAMDLHAASLPA